jgi:PAS domain S-box-containing protein
MTRGTPTIGPGSPLDPFASRARTRDLVEQLPVAVYVDSDELHACTTLYISPNVEKVIGHPASAVMADPDLWDRAMHRDDRGRVWELWEGAWREGTPFRAEYRFHRPDGEEVWIRDSSVIVRSESGERVAWQGILEDLTAEKRSEEDVRTSEAKYRALVERVPAVVYEMDHDDERRTLYVSPHVEQVLGYSRAEWLSQPDIWIELLHQDDREVVLAHHDRHSETGEPWDLEYRLIASDGRVVWVQDRATLISGHDQGKAAWHGVMINVTAEHDAREMLLLHKEDLERRVAERTTELQETNELMSLEIGERRRMESELRRVEERYRRLVEDTPGITYLWDIVPGAHSRSFGYVSPRVHEILGYDPEGWQPCERVHPHDQARVAEAVDRSARTGEPFRMEYRFLASDGRVVWVLDHASLITRTDAGDPATFQGMMLDVTARKDAELKAEEAEDRFRALTEHGPVVVYSYELVHTGDGEQPRLEVTYVSPQAADLVGYPVEHWLDEPLTWLDMMHPDDRDRISERSQHSWRTGDPWTHRYRMIRSDGSVVWLLDAGCLLDRDDLGRPKTFQGILLETTRDEEINAEIRASEQSQRSALDGVLAIPWSETVHPDTGFEEYTYIGPQSTEILGYTPEELMRERAHFLRMVHPDDASSVEEAMRRSEDTGVWEASYRVLRRDGDVRWLRSFGRRVTAPDEVPELWHGVAVDVTASYLGGGWPGVRVGVEEAEGARDR